MKIKEALDFSFVEEETKDLYSPDFGRPAFPAEVMFRMVFLEFFYNLSDVEVSRQCRYNILFRWFVGLKIEDRVPDDSSLVVFRKRLGEERFERLFARVVAEAKEKGLLKERYKIVDATVVVADVAIPNTVNLIRQGAAAHFKGDREKGLLICGEIRASIQVSREVMAEADDGRTCGGDRAKPKVSRRGQGKIWGGDFGEGRGSGGDSGS